MNSHTPKYLLRSDNEMYKVILQAKFTGYTTYISVNIASDFLM